MSTECPLVNRIWSRDSLRQRLVSITTPQRAGKRKAARLGNSEPKRRLLGEELAIHSGLSGGISKPYQAVPWTELPLDVMQAVTDLLPTFKNRARLQMTCKSLLRLDRNFAEVKLDLGGGVNVDLRNIQFGDHGARAVAQALQNPQYRAVLRLNLGSNSITDDGAETIAAALVTCPAKVKRVYLDNNSISDRGAQAIMSAVACHGTIVELDLHNNNMTLSGKSVVRASKSAATNKVLKNVFLNWQLPSPTYMDDVQISINVRMRSILMDWLTDVAQMLLNTHFIKVDVAPSFFLACSYLDRYLSQQPVERKRLQLVGVACFFLAVQHCESHSDDAPETSLLDPSNSVLLAKWFADVTDKAFTPTEVSETSQDIRGRLSADFEQPTLNDFLMRYLTWTGWRMESLCLAEYLLSLSVLSYSILQHPPHTVAAAAVLLTHDALETMFGPGLQPNWLQRLLRAAGVNTQRELIPCAEKLADLHASVYSGTSTLPGHRGPGRLAASRRYSTQQYHFVSKLPPTRPSLISSPLSPPTARLHDHVGVPYQSRLLMHTLDFTLHGAKRRRCF